MDLCVCKMCLTREVRLYSMTKYNLISLYENLTGLQVGVDKRLPLWVCAECGLRLMSYNKLRDRSLKSHQFICDLMNDSEENKTEEVIRLIDEEAKNFEPTLVKSETDVFHVDDESQSTSVKSEELGNDNLDKETDHTMLNFNDFQEDTDEDAKSFISEAGTLMDYQEEYIHFSDEEVSDIDLEKGATEQLGEIPTKQKEINAFASLNYEIKEDRLVTNAEMFESFENFQIGDISKISNLNLNEEFDELESKRLTIDYINATFKCTDCYEIFSHEEAYVKHMLSHAEKLESTSRSDVFKKSLSNERDIRAQFVGQTDSLQYTCSKCDFTTSVRSIAISHGGKHVGKKHRCPHCNKEYSHRTSCSNHIRTVHPSESECICELCGFSFINEKGVSHHKRQRHRSHNDDTPLEGPECEKCNLKFASPDAYKMHLKVSYKHADDKENIKSKKTESRVIPKNPISCEFCDVKCESARAYHKHFMKFHPDKNRTRYLFLVPTMCEICGRIFHNSTYLKEHLVVHKTGMNPYKCDICSKTFALKLHIQMHKKTHDKNRPTHPCQLCDKLFANRQNLNKHILIHTGEKPFECQACFKCFPTKDRMKCHYQYVHEKKPWPKRNRNRKRTTAAREAYS